MKYSQKLDWKRVFRVLFLCLLVITLSGVNGCISSGKTKKYYQLNLQSTPIGAFSNQIQTKPRNDGLPPYPLNSVLMVETVDIEDIYNDYRIVFRTSPHQLNYYNYHFWIKKPGRMVRDSIYDFLSDVGYFKRVIVGFSQGDPELLLKARVYIMEEIDQDRLWYGRLKMELEIKDFKTGQSIALHTFNRQLPLRQKRVEQLPVVISQILREELLVLFGKLPTALEERKKLTPTLDESTK